MPEPFEYRLADLGEGMADAEIIEWLVAVGDHVERDQTIVHVQTDKALVELPAPASGSVLELCAAAGGIVPVGGLLLILAPDQHLDQTLEAQPSAPATSHEVPTRAAAPTPAEPSAAASDTHTKPAHPVQAAPPVRKLARELSVDLETIVGTGTGGRVTAADVRTAAQTQNTAITYVAERPSEPSTGDRRVPLRGIPRAMARTMAHAWQTVPHITLFDEIDARPLLEAHRILRAQGLTELTLSAFFVRAAVCALRALPIVNASLTEEGDAVIYHDACNIGLAVAAPQGLIVPVIHQAQRLQLSELAIQIRHVTKTAHDGRLTPESLHGATFTVTNFGTTGGRFATPIVRPPEVAILGFGAIRTQPIVSADTVIAAPALPLSFSVDHRIIDGLTATAFIDHIATTLTEPIRLAMA